MNNTSSGIENTELMIVTGHRYPDGQAIAVRIERGVIVAVDPIEFEDSSKKGQRWIVPGFFDIQVNGFAGKSFLVLDVSVEDVRHIARAVLRTGVTQFLPTVCTAHMDVMCRQLSVIADAMHQDPLVAAMCPGIHIEGPFLHPEDGPRGAHPREHIRTPSIPKYERLAQAARGKVTMLTLAPDRPGALELIRHATRQGVIVALGHHRADADVLAAAIDAGAKLATHLGNGSDAILPRHDNYVWNQLGEDRLWASFIADGHHLPPATLRSMLRAKTLERSVLITDAIAAAGMPPGRYEFGDIEVELTRSGKVVLPGTPYMAGSAADMLTVIGTAIAAGGLSFTEAIKIASIQPATLMAGKPVDWSCQPGQPANVVELDYQPVDVRLTVRQVVAGQFAPTLQKATLGK